MGWPLLVGSSSERNEPRTMLHNPEERTKRSPALHEPDPIERRRTMFRTTFSIGGALLVAAALVFGTASAVQAQHGGGHGGGGHGGRLHSGGFHAGSFPSRR